MKSVKLQTVKFKFRVKSENYQTNSYNTGAF